MMSDTDDDTDDEKSEIERLLDDEDDTEEVEDVYLVDESDSSTTGDESVSQTHDIEDDDG